MNLGELRVELGARGYDYLLQDQAGINRANRWINEGYTRDICDRQPWPFLEMTATGAAPLSVDDVRDVLSVVDFTNGSVLTATDRRDLTAIDPKNTGTGTPWSYVLDGLDTFSTYPTSTTSLSVRYIGTPPLLANDADEPLVPVRFQNLIVDAAVIRALRDSDNWDAAAAAKQAFKEDLAEMEDAYFSRSFDPQFVLQTSEHEGF
jgi:hypothetical protein